METHVKVIAWVHIVFGILGVLGGILLFLLSMVGGAMTGSSDDMFIFGTLGLVIGCFVMAFSIPGIAGGFGLLKWRPWARVVILVLAFFNLFNFPLGTIIGGYIIWALLQEETARLFDSGGPAYTSFSDFE